MPADLTSPGQRPPRRARYLIPRDLPRRRELVAALGVALLLAHLLLAPAALVLAACFRLIGSLTRWRPQWLLAPAAAGLAWVLAAGPAAALAAAAAGPRAVAGLAAALITAPGRLGMAAAAADPRHWLPGQLPVALAVAAAETALAWWLGWLHTDEWDLAPPRPGLLVAARQRLNAAQLRAGGVVTRDGICLGVDRGTGRPAAVSWPDAAGGVLITGGSWAAVSATGFQFVHAAIRRRKPVIAVDLAGDPEFAAAVTAACAAADAPLQVFGAGGPAWYEPLQGGSPARRASLIAGLIDWAGRPEAARRDCTAILADLCALAAAAPAGPGVPVLDDVIGLLDPAALAARLERVPAYHPRRAALAARVRTAAARLAADPGPAAVAAGQLTALRASVLGRWLAPGPGGGQPATRINLGAVARDRSVALFSLGRPAHGRAAETIATLVALDAAGAAADLRRAGGAGDALAWFGGCEAADPAALGGLLAAGPEAGLACVLATTSAQAAGWLAGQARVLAVHRLADPGLAALIAPLTGARLTRTGDLPGAAAAGVPPPMGAPPAVPPLAALSPATAPPAAPPVPAVPAAAGAVGASPAAGAGGWPQPAGQPVAGAGPAGPGPVFPGGLSWQPVVPAERLCTLPDDGFTLITGGPRRRVSPLAQGMRTRIPEPRPVRQARLARLGSQDAPPPWARARWLPRLPARLVPAWLVPAWLVPDRLARALTSRAPAGQAPAGQAVVAQPPAGPAAGQAAAGQAAAGQAPDLGARA